MTRDDVLAFLRRRALKMCLWIAGVPVALAALMTIYFCIGGIEWGDWTIPDEAELRFELRNVPDEENSYLALRALTNLYRVAERDWDSDCDADEIFDKDFVRCYMSPFFVDGDAEDLARWTAIRCDPSSPERAARILSDNTEFLNGFHAALKREWFVNVDAREAEAERIKKGNPPSLVAMPLYKEIIGFAQLSAMRARVSLERGDVEAALSDITALHVLGQKILANSESLVEYLVGVLIEDFCLRKMCDAVAMGKVDDEIIKRFETMLGVSEGNAPLAWEHGLKSEIAKHFEGVEWFCDHPELAFEFGFLCKAAEFDRDGRPVQPLLGRIMAHWPGFVKFAMHRRKMLYHQAILDRAMLAGDDTLVEMILHEMSCNFLLPNGFGNWLQISLCPIFSPYMSKGNMARLRPRLVLAAEKWRRAHGGGNPPSLEALVPEYLAAVPADPWDKSGGALKYDASLGVVWTIGKNGDYEYKDGLDDEKTACYAFRIDAQPMKPQQ